MDRSKKKLSYSGLIAILAAALVVTIIGSVTLGRYPIGLRELGGIIASRFVYIEPFWSKTQESLLLMHRLPRIILACLVGCCLSSAGASYQGVFQNPMAAPDILGASSGAAFGAALAILLGLGGTFVMIFAFAGSIGTVLLVMYVGSRAKGKRVLGLILAAPTWIALMMKRAPRRASLRFSVPRYFLTTARPSLMFLFSASIRM